MALIPIPKTFDDCSTGLRLDLNKILMGHSGFSWVEGLNDLSYYTDFVATIAITMEEDLCQE